MTDRELRLRTRIDQLQDQVAYWERRFREADDARRRFRNRAHALLESRDFWRARAGSARRGLGVSPNPLGRNGRVRVGGEGVGGLE